MSRVFDGVEVLFVSVLAARDVGLETPVIECRRLFRASAGRGGQGRPVRAAPRGSLEGPGVQLSPATLGSDRPWGGPGCSFGGWTQRTSPLLNVLSGATEMLGDRPFLRVGSHGVLRPQPDGLTQIDGPATKVGATAILELASWLCPSLLKRPPDTGSGFRRLAARSRPG
jgi:hypothetical protein